MNLQRTLCPEIWHFIACFGCAHDLARALPFSVLEKLFDTDMAQLIGFLALPRPFLAVAGRRDPILDATVMIRDFQVSARVDQMYYQYIYWGRFVEANQLIERAENTIVKNENAWYWPEIVGGLFVVAGHDIDELVHLKLDDKSYYATMLYYYAAHPDCATMAPHVSVHHVRRMLNTVQDYTFVLGRCAKNAPLMRRMFVEDFDDSLTWNEYIAPEVFESLRDILLMRFDIYRIVELALHTGEPRLALEVARHGINNDPRADPERIINILKHGAHLYKNRKLAKAHVLRDYLTDQGAESLTIEDDVNIGIKDFMESFKRKKEESGFEMCVPHLITKASLIVACGGRIDECLDDPFWQILVDSTYHPFYAIPTTDDDFDYMQRLLKTNAESIVKNGVWFLDTPVMTQIIPTWLVKYASNWDKVWDVIRVMRYKEPIMKSQPCGKWLVALTQHLHSETGIEPIMAGVIKEFIANGHNINALLSYVVKGPFNN